MYLFFHDLSQVNGSDGMYKYEEIILERVSILRSDVKKATFTAHAIKCFFC